MYDNISSILKRSEQIRRGKGIVHNKRDTMGMGSIGNASDICKICVRIADGLDKHSLCIIPDRSFKTSFLVGINKCCLDPLVFQRMFMEIVGAAVNVF